MCDGLYKQAPKSARPAGCGTNCVPYLHTSGSTFVFHSGSCPNREDRK